MSQKRLSNVALLVLTILISASCISCTAQETTEFDSKDVQNPTIIKAELDKDDLKAISNPAPVILENLSARQITSGFGWSNSPVSGLWDWNEGIDIDAKFCDPVYAFFGGVVINAELSKSKWILGKYVKILHDTSSLMMFSDSRKKGDMSNISTLYAHLDKIIVTKGQKIKRGDLIGYTGSTGKSSGPNLHFEIRFNDKPLDPESLFEKIGILSPGGNHAP